MITSVLDFAIFIFAVLSSIVYAIVFFVVKKERSISRIIGFIALCLLSLSIAKDAFG